MVKSSRITRQALAIEEIERQTAAARDRQEALRASGLVAKSARYHAPSGRVFIEMSSGVVIGVPVSAIQSLAGATDKQLAAVEVDELGNGLRWDALDADVSVLGIIYSQLGYDAVRRSASAAGGRAKTEAKAAAARDNGQRGGRPRVVTCPECRSTFRVDPSKVPAGGIRARCSVCGAVISVSASAPLAPEKTRATSDVRSGLPRPTKASPKIARKQSREVLIADLIKA